MQDECAEDRYILQSNNRQDRHVSTTMTPYFTGEKSTEVNTQSDFLGEVYETEAYPSKTLQPVIGDFDDGLKKPYTFEVIKAVTDKKPGLLGSNEVRRVYRYWRI